MWKVRQHFVSSSFSPLYSILLLTWLSSYGFHFFSQMLPSVFLVSVLCSLSSPLLSYSRSVSCFLSGPLWPYIGLNSFRQHVITSLKDSTSSSVSSQKCFFYFLPDQPVCLLVFRHYSVVIIHFSQSFLPVCIALVYSLFFLLKEWIIS